MLKRRNVILAIAIGIGCTGGIMASGTTTASAHCDGVNDADGDNIPVDGRECAGPTTTIVLPICPPHSASAPPMQGCVGGEIIPNPAWSVPTTAPGTDSCTLVPCPRQNPVLTPTVEIGTAIAVTPPMLSLTPAVSVAPVLPTVVTVVPLPPRAPKIVVLPATL
jgi:hypothetical protein